MHRHEHRHQQQAAQHQHHGEALEAAKSPVLAAITVSPAATATPRPWTPQHVERQRDADELGNEWSARSAPPAPPR